ncbi:hypothetical protein BT93_F1132 [Corymbia citriodora subsp. variegata]|nr:hypothetical protein BT93_F1132 [Corymbia citriodora subsp. variegata]
MPREKDSFRDYVEFLRNNKWKCNFCDKEYGGSVTRIKAHLAGVAGYGIHGCNIVNSNVRSEAQKALKGKGPVEPNNGLEGNVLGSSYPHFISSSLTQDPHQPVAVSDEDAWRETSFAAMPNPRFDAIRTVGASSSAFIPLHETNVPTPSLPAQNLTPQRDFSFWTQLPQSQAGDSNIQLQNSSYPGGSGDLAPKALTNMPVPVNAEQGEPNIEIPQDARTYDAPVDSQLGTCGLVHENMPTLKRKLEELSSREADMDELETWCRKAQRMKGEYWSTVQAFREGRSLSLQQIERVDDLSNEVEEILGHCSFRKGSTTHVAGCRKSSPLVTTELVGDESEHAIKEICNYLMDDDIFIIGIWGMGGVGKTAILMHVHNRVLENPAFNDVFWITIPQEFNVYELQDEIANVVGLYNVSKDNDVKKRACILNRHLKKKKAVLILDGLWMHFDIEDVGIPVKKGGIKLLLITRSLDVCHKMLCQKQIKIEPLYWDPDYWSLFLQKLCFGRNLPLEIKKIAASILEKFGGLPLGIIEIATYLRGVEKVHEWKCMLRKLEELRVELNVFKRLKLSYVNLGDSQVQQCFLHSILRFGFQEDPPNDIELIESFIDDDLLGGIGTRQELHDQGNTILDKLRKCCLLDNAEEDLLVLHPLIRDMALHMVRSTTHMVKPYMGLKEIPDEKLWTDSLEKVFLEGNKIKEIPYGISPICPKLTRLSLNDNVSLEAIHTSFFRHLNGLKVIEFSRAGLRELPDAISHLESLEALLLQECKELHHIPCVRRLESLKKLDLHGCAMLEEVPEGMEMLVNLRYLDLHGTKINTLPERVLEKLVNLQYMLISHVEDFEPTKVEGFYCYTLDVETFNACVRLLKRTNLQQYALELSASINYSLSKERSIIIEDCHSIAAKGDGEIGGNGCALFLENVQELIVVNCSGVTNLCDIGPLDNLEEMRIEECEKLEELGPVRFPRLRKLNIYECSKLKNLLEEGQGLPCLQQLLIQDSEELEGINIAAQNLRDIKVWMCPKMKRVMEWEWLATHLPNLKSIEINVCKKLEVIIGGPFLLSGTHLLTSLKITECDNMKGVLLTHDMLLHFPFLECIKVDSCKSIEVIIGTVPNMTPSSFPKLTRLFLSYLPELKSICDGIMSCDSIENIDIRACPKLRRIPLQLPVLDSGLLSPPHSLREIRIDQQTWQTLEWDNPLARSSLEPFAHFPR